jgi:phosphopantetheinyl transferase
MNIFIVEFQKKKETLKYSRVLLKYLLSNFYKKDSQILEDNGKPYIDDKLHFSISHSQNILVIAFDEYPIGIDIEYSLKDRKYNDLLKQMGCEATRDISKEEFYKIWNCNNL